MKDKTTSPSSEKGSKKYIIVAEDDRFYSTLFRLKLENSGFEVDVFPDGAQTLQAAYKKKPDLILLDLIMPVADGFETLREIKATNSALKEVKVIVLSNLSQEEDMKRALDLGASSYFVKADISIMDMVEKVKEAVGEK
jgi:DNA-binding response OmpR family regulator